MFDDFKSSTGLKFSDESHRSHIHIMLVIFIKKFKYQIAKNNLHAKKNLYLSQMFIVYFYSADKY